MDRECKSCVFWDSEGDEGVCRFNPPVLAGTMAQALEGIQPDDAVWPRTLANEWCGSYVSSIAEKTPAQKPDKLIREIGVSTRIRRSLARENIYSVQDLLDYKEDLFEIRDLGDKSVAELLAALENAGVDTRGLKVSH